MSVGPNEKCVNKVMMVEETEYQEEVKLMIRYSLVHGLTLFSFIQIECHHSYDKKCHVTYVTDYEPQQEEDCDENFIKNCYIEYKTMAFDTPVKICNQKLVRNCDKPGKSTRE